MPRGGESDASPLVSVIVTAFNRRTYLLDALRSVRKQTLDRSLFEVIVTKNFEDSTIDQAISQWGYRSLLCAEVPPGAQLRDAVRAARGSIIAFLDDDDIWDPGKLQHVADTFREMPDLSYYGHAALPMNRSGSVDFGKLRRSQRFYAVQIDGSKVLFHPDSLNLRFIDELFAANPGNNSSITIKRSALDRFSDALDRMVYSTDHFLLVAALAGTGSVMVERMPLAKWRIHKGNTSAIDLTGFASFRAGLIETVRKLTQDNLLFGEMARGSGKVALETYLQSKVAMLRDLERLLGANDRGGATSGWLASIRSGASGPGYLDYWARARRTVRLAAGLSPVAGRVALYLYLQHLSKR